MKNYQQTLSAWLVLLDKLRTGDIIVNKTKMVHSESTYRLGKNIDKLTYY